MRVLHTAPHVGAPQTQAGPRRVHQQIALLAQRWLEAGPELAVTGGREESERESESKSDRDRDGDEERKLLLLNGKPFVKTICYLLVYSRTLFL